MYKVRRERKSKEVGDGSVIRQNPLDSTLSIGGNHRRSITSMRTISNKDR